MMLAPRPFVSEWTGFPGRGFMKFHRIVLAAALCALAVGCANSNQTSGSGVGGGDDNGSGNPPSTEGTPKVPVAAARDGTVYRQEITSPIGDTAVFQGMAPTPL